MMLEYKTRKILKVFFFSGWRGKPVLGGNFFFSCQYVFHKPFYWEIFKPIWLDEPSSIQCTLRLNSEFVWIGINMAGPQFNISARKEGERTRWVLLTELRSLEPIHGFFPWETNVPLSPNNTSLLTSYLTILIVACMMRIINTVHFSFIGTQFFILCWGWNPELCKF